jgi:predicted N-acetyltransferase YhbS
MQTLKIRPIGHQDIAKVKQFTDRAIGTNYYSESELEDIFNRSKDSKQTYTLVLTDDLDNEILGIRITYPPGNWQHGKGKGLTPNSWTQPIGKTAYFQSLFVDPALTGQGWGRKLSLVALRLLQDSGAKAVVTHSWKESPNDSSGKYLRALGFQLIATHTLYWHDVDYVCTRCGNQKCVCTAEEMIYYFKETL